MAFVEPVSYAPDELVGRCDVKTVGACTVISLLGEHDCATAVSLTQTLAAIAREPGGDVIVDLSGVRFMSAATVRVLDQARTALAERTRAMTLRDPSTSARRLLE